MLPNFLVPETEQRANGESEPIALGDARGKLITLTLGITRIIEQESLDVAIYGSRDGKEWEPQPLFSFPQKFYCGTYTVYVDLTKNPDIQFLKASWSMNRWGRGEPKPLFGFYVFADEAREIQTAAGAA